MLETINRVELIADRVVNAAKMGQLDVAQVRELADELTQLEVMLQPIHQAQRQAVQPLLLRLQERLQQATWLGLSWLEDHRVNQAKQGRVWQLRRAYRLPP